MYCAIWDAPQIVAVDWFICERKRAAEPHSSLRLGKNGYVGGEKCGRQEHATVPLQKNERTEMWLWIRRA